MHDGYLTAFKPETGAVISRMLLDLALSSEFSMSKDGTKLAAGDWAGRLFLFDLTRSQTKVLTNGLGAVRAVALSADGRRLAAGGKEAVVNIWDLETETRVASFHGHGKDIVRLIYSPDGGTLLSGSNDGTVRAWDLRGRPRSETVGIPSGWNAILLSRNGRFLSLYNTNTHYYAVMDLQTQKERYRGHAPPRDIHSTCISFDGEQIAGGLGDGRVEIWRQGKLFRTFQAHSNAVEAIEFSPNSAHLATATRNAEVRVWDGAGQSLVCARNFAQPLNETLVRELVFSDEAGLLFVPGPDVHLVSLRPGGRDREIELGRYLSCIAATREGGLVAVGLKDDVLVWETRSLRLVQRLRGGRGDFGSLSFSPDGQRLLGTDALGVTWLWDMRTGRDVGRFYTNARFPVARFTEDGDTVTLFSNADVGLQTLARYTAPSLAEIDATEQAQAKARQIGLRK
jgi:WD40 repeat protein